MYTYKHVDVVGGIKGMDSRTIRKVKEPKKEIRVRVCMKKGEEGKICTI